MIDAKTFHGRGRGCDSANPPRDGTGRLLSLDAIMRYTSRICRKTQTTLLKLNLSWQIWFPAASTDPVAARWRHPHPPPRRLLREHLVAAFDNNTVHGRPRGRGGTTGTPSCKNIMESAICMRVIPASSGSSTAPGNRFAVLDRFYPDGILIPRGFVGKNILHLPTMKTDGTALFAGAMHNAFGGLLGRKSQTDARQSARHAG